MCLLSDRSRDKGFRQTGQSSVRQAEQFAGYAASLVQELSMSAARTYAAGPTRSAHSDERRSSGAHALLLSPGFSEGSLCWTMVDRCVARMLPVSYRRVL